MKGSKSSTGVSARQPEELQAGISIPEASPVLENPRREWNDATLNAKTTALIATAVMGGILVGMAEVHSGHRGWVVAVGLIIVVAGLTSLAKRWICRPVQELTTWWRRVYRERFPGALDELPIGRHDEVGELARAFYQLTVNSIRHDQEARQLRRTLDHRIALATKQATQELHRLTLRDPLTDLGNRRFLEQHLEPLVKSVLESGSTLWCISLDCDCFKQINDTLGHAAGDEVLIFLASLIRANVRQEDYLVRLGGDEFVILMPDCEAARVAMFTQRLRTMFKQYVSASAVERLPVDLSIGVACLPDHGVHTGHDLLAKADEHLYAAKRAGKGRVIGLE